MKQVVNDTLEARRFLTENKSWQSEIGSWEIDLLFCERMVDIYGLKAESDSMQETKSTITVSIHDLISIRLDNLKSQLKANEGILNRLVDDELLLKDRQMPFRHSDDKSEMDNTRVLVLALQGRLYSFIKELKAL
jgi:hypothetical protein